MNYSLIDIGSNSIRLTVYEIHGSSFKPLFHSKIMAGLAGYVEKEKMTKDGIEMAISSLLEFKKVLQALSVDKVSVFATASLRNIANTWKVVKKVSDATGFEIEVIDEEEEALLSYKGAKLELPEVTKGAFADIGGASTEIITFSNNTPTNITSYRIGSLNLYKKCVRKILPVENTIKRMDAVIAEELTIDPDFTFTPSNPLICVGGTARAVLKITQKLYELPEQCNRLSADQVETIFRLLSNNKKKTARLILRMCPDRIHTIVPGLTIMTHILHLYDAKEIIISNYGIREGFLCKKIIPSNTITTSSPKTEN